ncbi:MAG: aspartate aminotransferase family protein, partial [Actinobacteria bacterium]|nr:aspartate aminotransferase family protein [Actinomycetota bacterium]
HSNPYVVKRLKKQIQKIIQPSNVYYNQPQVELARKLCELTGFGEKVFFANSGTEAIEGAIKLARKYSVEKYNSSRYEIISFFKSFHGRTYGALSATAQPEKQKVFQPLVEGFRYANLNDIDSVKQNMNENTCAVLIEPIQGEGGINVSEIEFLRELREICSRNDILLILDEIQTGFGRTGKIFAYQHYDIYPDILVLAKSLGGGMPIGAIVSKASISSVFSPGSHGSTFGGNAASCAAGCAVVEYLVKNNLSERARVLGDYFMEMLKRLGKKYSNLVKEVRGMGLMIGMELYKPVAGELVEKALRDHFVLNKVSPYTLRFLPPLVVSRKSIDMLIEWLDRSLKDF